MVVAEALNTTGELLELLGPHLLQEMALDGHDVQASLISTSIKIFSRKHECQKKYGDDTEIEEVLE